MQLDFVVGTRPEITKTFAIIKSLNKLKTIQLRLMLTGQQAYLVDLTIDDLKVNEYCQLLWLYKPSENYYDANWILKAENELRLKWEDIRPDFVIIQGDTTSALLGAEVSYSMGISCVHLEAGIRHLHNKFIEQEELNRRKITQFATYHFSPTDMEIQNLVKEGISRENIDLIGDLSAAAVAEIHSHLPRGINSAVTLNDALMLLTKYHAVPNDMLCNAYILCTFHRPISLQFRTDLVKYLHNLSVKISPIRIVICKRPDTRWEAFYKEFENNFLFILVDALPPVLFQVICKYSNCIVTDSAGVQQEGLLTGKRVIVMRDDVEQYRGHARLLFIPPPFNTSISKDIMFCRSNPVFKKISSAWSDLGDKIAHKIMNKLQRKRR
jgi:UDP-N-acetylglucosamine 2-epimerase